MTLRRTNERGGFTLIELLAVMAIMAIIAGITVVAVTGITRGNSVMKAAQEIQGAIDMARQAAVTRHAAVLFLCCQPSLSNDNPTCSTAIDGIDYWGRAYAVYDSTHQSYIQAWRILPGNVIFDASNDPKADKTSIFSHVDHWYTRPFPADWNTRAEQLAQMPGICLKSDGSLCTDNKIDGEEKLVRRICLSEGMIKPDGTVTNRPNGLRYGVLVHKFGGTEIVTYKGDGQTVTEEPTQ